MVRNERIPNWEGAQQVQGLDLPVALATANSSGQNRYACYEISEAEDNDFV